MARTETGARHQSSPSIGALIRRRPLAVAKKLGPGILAGAADNDPTTVATLAVIGSTTVYGLSWLVLLVIPMLVVVQVISASVGVRARQGLEDVVREHYGRGWALVLLLAVLAVTVVTLAADLAGGAAALSLLTGRSYRYFIAPFALGVAALLLWGSYQGVERVLRWVVLVFVTYVVAAVLARPNWGDILRATVRPHLSSSKPYVEGMLALLGTTLTSYAYVWETIEEAEERPHLRRIGLVRLDAGLGMVAAGLIFWFIVIATGATLGVNAQPVQTAQDAARALAPLAGPYAAIVFGVGLLASAVIAVPVLAGTSAYVFAEAFGFREGLTEPFQRARPFYFALLGSIIVATTIAYSGISPIRLLWIGSVAGGLATPLSLLFLLRAARDRKVMGERRIGVGLLLAGVIVALLISAAAALYLWRQFA